MAIGILDLLKGTDLVLRQELRVQRFQGSVHCGFLHGIVDDGFE